MKDSNTQDVNSKTIDLLSTKILMLSFWKKRQVCKYFANSAYTQVNDFLSYKILWSKPFTLQYKYLWRSSQTLTNYLKLKWSFTTIFHYYLAYLLRLSKDLLIDSSVSEILKITNDLCQILLIYYCCNWNISYQFPSQIF